MIENDDAFVTFDDVCLKTGLSTVPSRSEVDITTQLGDYELQLPVMTAAMDTVTSEDMAEVMLNHGACVFHHRNQSVDQRISLLEAHRDHPNVRDKKALNGVAVGTSATSEDVQRYIGAGANLIGLEVAHAYHVNTIEAVQRIGPICNDNGVLLMVGNFSSPDAIQWLRDNTSSLVDIVKVSQGGGSCCTTRVVTGIGKPTLQAVMDLDTSYDVIADGGLRTSGDVAKALGAGASAVMLGSMLSATDETPGEIIEKDGKKYKAYRGMASKDAKEDDDTNPSDHAKNVEGVSTLNPYKGSAVDILKQIREGLQSSISCCGFEDLQMFRKEARFVRVSRASNLEGRPHAIST